MADELLVHYRGGVGKSNEKGGGGTLEAGRGDLKGDAFFKLKSGIHFTFMAALRCACTAERGACWLCLKNKVAQGLQMRWTLPRLMLIMCIVVDICDRGADIFFSLSPRLVRKQKGW